MDAPQTNPVHGTVPIESGCYGCALTAIAVAALVIGFCFACTGWADLRELEEQTGMPAKVHAKWLRVGGTELVLGWANLLAGAACLRWPALHGVPAIAAIMAALGWGLWALSLT